MKQAAFTAELHRARDAENAFAVRLAGEHDWRARTGFGSQFEPLWNVEFQCRQEVDLHLIDWDLVLERAVEAYRLSDPIVTNYDLSHPVP